MLQTVYQHGVRIKIDPTRDNDEVVGPVVTFDQRKTHLKYSPTDELTFDVANGSFKAGAPMAVAYAGRVSKGGSIQWNDVSVSAIEVSNPEGIFDPVDVDNPWLSVSIYSMDDKPLSQSQMAAISIASTSFNTGYSMGDHNGFRISGSW